MNRRSLAGGAVALATGALTYRLLRRRTGDLESPLSGVERTYRWRGMDVAYTVVGDPNAPDLLLVHRPTPGTTSHEFGPLTERLADDFHVYAVDLPGFGRSDRPPLVYSTTLYTEFLRDFTAEVADDPIVLAPSRTAAFAALAARESSLERLVLVCPVVDTASKRRWLRSLVRTPVLGTLLFDAIASAPVGRYLLQRGCHETAAVPDSHLEYARQSARLPGARFAPASLLGGDLDPASDLTAVLSDLETPVTLLWGRETDRPSLEEGRALAEAVNADLAVVDAAGRLVHLEQPDAVGAFLTESFARLEHA
ncbi:alpha/beta fold hydrolase [Natronobiforma cellulositropha]|uniref:alpha/beta fold hydrolase n=1 Tax=Natronobiforma cellulositropha TaxID=1679076 RepID=UPI0021D61582|nr:alpha/beta hydrolase [Natronobiforma cellulositropha]